MDFKFKSVFTKDWYGVMDEFEIIHVVHREGGKYSCTFKNSQGDTEKKVVSVQELFQC